MRIFYGQNNKRLQDKDDKKAHALFKEIIARSAISDEYYSSLMIF